MVSGRHTESERVQDKKMSTKEVQRFKFDAKQISRAEYKTRKTEDVSRGSISAIMRQLLKSILAALSSVFS